MKGSKNFKLFLLKNMAFVLFAVVFIVFGFLCNNWFTITNFENIARQSSYIGILAAGMTFVLLTGGVDLSVGANMFLSASICGLLINRGWPIWSAILICLLVGFLYGCFNAFFIVKMKVMPFLVTLATLMAGRGLTLVITKSEAVSMPASLVSGVGSGRLFGILPYPVLIFLLVAAAATIFLKFVPLGRQIYAVGKDSEGAKKAGINLSMVLAFVYILNGVLAALAAIVSVTQIGNVTSGFGMGDEFDAISASILGGTSMMGGVGTVFPGAVIGVFLIQMVQAGLIYLQVDLYLQPIISALIILFAVFLDSVRTRYIIKLEQRNIRTEESTQKIDKNFTMRNILNRYK